MTKQERAFLAATLAAWSSHISALIAGDKAMALISAHAAEQASMAFVKGEASPELYAMVRQVDGFIKAEEFMAGVKYSGEDSND
jgi:hypothetical protein